MATDVEITKRKRPKPPAGVTTQANYLPHYRVGMVTVVDFTVGAGAV